MTGTGRTLARKPLRMHDKQWVVFTLRLPPTLYRAVVRRAHKDAMSIQTVIREAIKRGLKP